MAENELLGWVVRVAEALRRADIPHALAGGLALAVHGHPRATTDIDFVVTSDPDAIARARVAFATMGLLQTRRPIVKFRRISMLRVAAPPETGPEPISIDLLLPPDVMEEIFDRSRSLSVSGTDVSVVSREDLIVLKLLRASDQDIVDIRTLAGDGIDRAYVDRSARALRIVSRLARALPPSRAARRRGSRGRGGGGRAG